MKNLIIATVAVAMLAFAGNVFASDISQDTLSEMGLGDMQSMSDAQGMDVRGMGGWWYSPATAKVSGFVSVNLPGITIFETKYASDSGSKAFAKGGFTVSVTSIEKSLYPFSFSMSKLIVSEVGFAYAGAH